MKIKNLLLAIVAISLFVSCEKDEDNDSIISKNSHRIKQINYEGGKFTFTYEGEKLVNSTEYKKDESDNWLEDYKIEISYSGDNATATRYSKESGTWEMDDKAEYLIQNGLIKEENSYDYEDGTWVEDRKWTYQYSGRNLSDWQSFHYDDGIGALEQYEKGEYFYQNSKLEEYKVYELDESGNWSQYDKETFTYDGSNLIKLINYGLDASDNWENSYKYEYQYSGDNLSQMEYFYWNRDDSQWESRNSLSYTYNSNGYVSETLDGYGFKTTFEYEEGHGNGNLFLSPPRQSVYGELTYKSAGINRNKKYVPYYQRQNNR